MIKNKKAELFSKILYLGLLIISFIALIYFYQHLTSGVECSGLNPSCPQDQYCGVDFKCYHFPQLYKQTTQTIINKTYTLLPGIAFILVSLIISYFIFRGPFILKRISKERGGKEERSRKNKSKNKTKS